MRIAYRLLLLGSVAACTPMVPTPPQPQPAPPPVVEPAPATPAPTPPPAQTDLSEAYDHASFDAWKQSFPSATAAPANGSTPASWRA